jgi:hypothetical protein
MIDYIKIMKGVIEGLDPQDAESQEAARRMLHVLEPPRKRRRGGVVPARKQANADEQLRLHG